MTDLVTEKDKLAPLSIKSRLSIVNHWPSIPCLKPNEYTSRCYHLPKERGKSCFAVWDNKKFPLNRSALIFLFFFFLFKQTFRLFLLSQHYTMSKFGTDENPIDTSYYELLNIPTNAEAIQIKKAYRYVICCYDNPFHPVLIWTIESLPWYMIDCPRVTDMVLTLRLYRFTIQTRTRNQELKRR